MRSPASPSRPPSSSRSRWAGWPSAWAPDDRSLGPNDTETWLLVLAGIVSTTPLLLFTAAARRLRYSTLGMLQFVAPTLQFLLAVALYAEQFTRAHAIAFGAIWTALALYVASLVRDLRAQRKAAAAPELCEP